MANTIQKESKIIYLQIGQNYENLGVQKQFDVSEWTAEFPDAHIYLLFKRPGEEAAAPVNTTLDEDGILTWTVSNWETGIIGIGFAEIRAIDSSTGLVKKSHVIPCSIEASVTDEDAAPDYPSWVDRMLQFGENVDSIYATLPHELEEGIASIQQEAQEQTEAIEQKGITTRASIPADYTTLSDEVTDLKSAIDNVQNNIGCVQQTLLTNSSIRNSGSAVVLPSNIAHEANYCCLCVPCAEGDTFTISGKGGLNTRLWAFAYSNGAIINASVQQATATDLILVAPANAAYFSYNSSTSAASRSVYKGIKPTTVVSELTNRIDRIDVVLGEKQIFCQLENGTLANASNANAVNITNYIPCNYGDIVTFYPNRKNADGYWYIYGYRTYDSAKNVVVDGYVFNTEKKSVYIGNNIAYIRFCVLETDGASYNPLRVETYSGAPYAIVHGASVIDTINSEIININDVSLWSFGSLGSMGEDYARDNEIRTKDYIPIDQIVKIHYGEIAQIRFCVYSSAKTFIVRESDVPHEISTEYILRRWPGAAYVRFSLYVDETPVADLSNYALAQIYTVKTRFDAQLFFEKDADHYADLISQSKYVYASADAQAQNRTLTLLHFSDVHGNYSAMQYALKVYNAFPDKIDDMLHTGDVVTANFSDGIQNWIVSGCAIQVLNVIGNHDTEENLVLQAAGKDNVYNTIFAPYISGWGVTQPSGVDDSTSADYHALYYYKDYTGPKIRLIILDTNFWDAAETAWLTAALADAKANSYAVILACHAVKKLTEMTESNFSAYTGDGINETSNAYANQPANWLDPVTAFVNDGGEFICMLAGHNHAGHMGTVTNYDDVFCFVSDKASVARTSGAARISGELNANTVNIVTVNVAEKLFKIVKIGAEVDGKMRGKHVFCYDYANKRIISQW